MKNLVLFAFIVSALLPLRADEQLKNPDFTDGRSHWKGDGESFNQAESADAAPTLGENSVAGQNGLVLKLSHRDWVQISQDFRPLATSGILTIAYKFSDGLTFSPRAEDYMNVPALMGFQGWRSFNVNPGTWMALFIETERQEMEYYKIPFQAGNGVQTYKGTITGFVPRVDKTISIAFPPGQGTVTLLHVSLDSGTISPSSGQGSTSQQP